jgi:hypothetical protein
MNLKEPGGFFSHRLSHRRSVFWIPILAQQIATLRSRLRRPIPGYKGASSWNFWSVRKVSLFAQQRSDGIDNTADVGLCAGATDTSPARFFRELLR